jgi:hypothetical protein
VKAAVGTGAHLAYPLSHPLALTVIKSGTDADTVTSSPPGINCGSACSNSFEAGSAVTLTATAGAGSVFTGWSGGGCSGTSTTCPVTMDSDKTVAAAFMFDCSGGAVVLQNVTFISGNTYNCIATTSLTAGIGVTVQSGATVNFRAPIINLQPGFRVENGAVFSGKQ